MRAWISRRLAALALAATLLPAGAGVVAAQAGAPDATRRDAPSAPGAVAEPGSELTVYLLTMGPGDAIWEKFGHNALWILDRRSGRDVAYNWGMFDFASEDFISRFMQGRMRYWMEAFPTMPMVNAYASADRSVWAQELDLTPAEKHALYEFVEWNAREENRYYTYDYYRDNCSTRVRDALDRVLGGRISAMTDTVPTGTTYRSHTRRLTHDAQPLYTGIDLMLGPAVDRPISAWEEMFLPMRLRDRARDLAITREDGTTRPLVVGETQLFAASRADELARPANRLPLYVALGGALALLLGGLALVAARGSRAARTGFAVAAAAWSTIAGFAGTIMLLTWTLTDHTVAYANENLLQLSPLSLLLAVMVPRALLRTGAGDAGTTRRLAVAVAALAVLGFVLQVAPMLDQVNGQTIALALPAHLALAWGMWTLSARRRSPSTPPASAPPSPARRERRSGASAPGAAAS